MTSIITRLTQRVNLRLVTQIRLISNGRRYSEKHEWISVENDNIGRVGISDHAQDALGDVVYVQVPEVGTDVKQFDEVGAIESVKAASELLTPASGSVVEVNSNLESKPALVNTSCYDEGWLFKLKLTDVSELDKLMDEDSYKNYLEKSKDI
ncbi:Glycine cleavage system H protein, mitochondrial, partial [Fragariocoptes setiger]